MTLAWCYVLSAQEGIVGCNFDVGEIRAAYVKFVLFLLWAGLLLLTTTIVCSVIWAVQSLWFVRRGKVMIVEYLGEFHSVCEAGWHFLPFPFYRPLQLDTTIFEGIEHDSIAYPWHKREPSFFLPIQKETVVTYQECPVYTKDRFKIYIKPALIVQLVDPKSYAYKVENASKYLQVLLNESLAGCIRFLALQDISEAQENDLSSSIKNELSCTEQWGIKVTRVILTVTKYPERPQFGRDQHK